MLSMDGHPPLPPTPEGGADAVFAIGVCTFPYLADHGFQDMVVLPGSFYIDLALSLHRERFGRGSATVRNAVFQSPIILSNDETHVTVDVTDRGTFVEYVFCEQAGAPKIRSVPSHLPRRSGAPPPLHPPGEPSRETPSPSWSVQKIQPTAPVVLYSKPV